MESFIERETPLCKDHLLAGSERRGKDLGVTLGREFSQAAVEAGARQPLGWGQRDEVTDGRMSPPRAEPVLLGPDIDDLEACHGCNCRLWGDRCRRHGRSGVRQLRARVILVVTQGCAQHEVGAGHPERPARLSAALAGLRDAGLDDAIDLVAAQPAPLPAILRVHDAALIERLSALDELGGGFIDGDTAMNAHSFGAARLAAGAGLVAIEQLRAGTHRAALCVVRPPGHHATPSTAMGFCLFNSIGVTAAALVAAGERVAIIDFDAHHGNGTQEVFYESDQVLFVSLHQFPWYPGTGRVDEIGRGPGAGYTVNIPFAAGTSGDAYRHAFEAVVWPKIEGFRPTWILVSAGYDGHRLDPLAQLGLTSGDYGDLARQLVAMAPSGRLIAFLEGGYHLDSLASSVAATVGAFADVSVHAEEASSGSRADHVIAAVRAQHGLR